jgi:hypothetical protein
MGVTKKEDAQTLARLNLEEDASQYTRRIEAIISYRRPNETVSVEVHDKELAQHLASTYKSVGWTTKVQWDASRKYWTVHIS